MAAIPGTSEAAQSLAVTAGKPLHISIPSAPPYTTLSNMRVEYRLHNWTTPAKTSTLFTLGGSVGAPFLVFHLKPNNELCVVNYTDSLPDYGGLMCADITGVPDVVVRLQRDVSGLAFNYEVRSAANIPLSTYCGVKHQTFGCPMRKASSASWEGVSEIGDAGSSTDVQLAWLKWYSTVVPAGTGSLVESTPADLADWRFDGDVAEAAGGAGPTIQGQAQFSTTPVYTPACFAGTRRTFRAGFPGKLDGSASSPLDGGVNLNYQWTELSGPSTVIWDGGDTAQPSVSGMIFGSYVFQLKVTDSSGQSSSCTIKDGAVASDDNGVVITDNPTLDALIGPQIRFGASPWPWFDDRHRAAADLQSRNLDVYFTSFWDTPLDGTITVTTNSTTVRGTGTAFTSTFCQGPDNPTKVKNSGIALLAWHPTADGKTGRRWFTVASCQSDTELTTLNAWTPDLPAGTMQFSYADEQVASTWIYNPDPCNFYDNVVAFYTLYYRSGIDDYLIAARKLADRFWESPRMDRGAACQPESAFCTFPRNISQLGLVVRALDGRPDMWPGLRAMWAKFTFNIGYFGQFNQVEDAREEGYQLAMVAYCALADPDAANRAVCKTAIAKSFPIAWTPFKGKDGNWPTLWYPGAPSSSWDSKSTVTVSNGSNSVTGNGTSWAAGQFPNKGTSAVWFTNTAARPADNSGGDPTYYTATWVDATHMTLDRPYEGTSGTHGWMLGGTVQPLGWGAEPFVLGILATAFDFAARAIEDTDPATAALAHRYNVTAANWLRTTAYWPASKALYYQAGEVNCQQPISDTNEDCTGGNGIPAARTLNAMIMRALGAAYLYSNDSALKDYGDLLFSAMYSKPGTGGPNPDGSYVSSLDDATGFYMVGPPPLGTQPKYFGMFFGFGNNSTWPAYRVGGLAAPSTRVLHIPRQRPKGAESMRVTVTEPSGRVHQMLCGFSSCTVTVDGRQGDPSIVIEYLPAAARQ